MDNPYQPPASGPATSARAFQWMRVLGWSVLIFAAANLIGLLSGLSMALWEIYGTTINEAVANARVVRRVAGGVVAVILYWRFAAGVPSQALLHVLALFVLVQIIDLSFTQIVFAVPIRELFDVRAIGRNGIAAIIGFAFAAIGTRFRTASLRDPT